MPDAHNAPLGTTRSEWHRSPAPRRSQSRRVGSSTGRTNHVAPDAAWQQIDPGDGRIVEVVTSGAVGRTTLVLHNGTPTAALPFPPLVESAARHDLSVVMFSRPGYAGSTPMPGRCVADVAPS